MAIKEFWPQNTCKIYLFNLPMNARMKPCLQTWKLDCESCNVWYPIWTCFLSGHNARDGTTLVRMLLPAFFIDAVLVQTNILQLKPLESLKYSCHQLVYKFRRNHDFRATCLVPSQLANFGSSVTPKLGSLFRSSQFDCLPRNVIGYFVM